MRKRSPQKRDRRRAAARQGFTAVPGAHTWPVRGRTHSVRVCETRDGLPTPETRGGREKLEAIACTPLLVFTLAELE